MINITERLYEILFKYNLDEVYPQYRKKYFAEKILKIEISKWITNHAKILFVYNDKIEYIIIDKMIDSDFSVDWLCVEQINQEENRYSEYDKIIVTFFEKEKIKNTFDYIWIYDIFQNNSLFFEDDFYKLTEVSYGQWYGIMIPRKEWKNNFQLEFCTQKMRAEESNGEEKVLALKKCLFLALHMKNFLCARACVQMLQEATDECQDVVCMMKEIEGLLLEIKEQLKSRKQRDIIVYWLDCINSGMEMDMPYLKSVLENNVMFTNAFTVTNNTIPTAQTIFRQRAAYIKNEMRPEMITRKNSPLLVKLQENDYVPIVVGGYFEPHMEKAILAQQSKELYESCSMIFWDSIENVLNTPKPVMVIAHALVEGHLPFFSTKINMRDVEGFDERNLLARKELDEQLEFYDEFWQPTATNIYLSDHGLADLRKQNHIILGIKNISVVPRKIEKMFSIINFISLLEKIILGEDDFEKVCNKDYVVIERLDQYSLLEIKRHIIQKTIKENALLLFGYKGVVTKEYMYITFSTGKEWLAKREENMSPPHLCYYQEDICEEALLPYFREIVGEYPKERLMEEKFKYSRYLHKICDNILLKQNNMMQIIENALMKCSDESVAIRMGGNHSVELYNRLSPLCRRKIKCFIDNGEHCVCERFGLPIINVEQMQEGKLEAVCLSSYVSIEALRKETEKYKDEIHIIDIYKMLGEHGYECSEEFYLVGEDDEYYDVDFPFDEVND